MSSVFRIAAICLLLNSAYAQRHRGTYTLEGSVNATTGTMILMPVSAPVYYPYQHTIETKVKDGAFTFTDTVTYPLAFQLGYKLKNQMQYVSGMFFVEPGKQSISCNIDDSLRSIPGIVNAPMLEWKGEYNQQMSSANKEIDKAFDLQDSLYKVYHQRIPENEAKILENIKDKALNKRNVALLNYVIKNPNSYVALWQLIEYLPGGYKPVYDSIYSHLSARVRGTYTGIQLRKNLHAIKSITVGHQFPEFQLFDTGLIKTKVPEISHNNKYTLVDFWFSHCFPCLRQFPALRELYKKYKKNGFEIVGISVDETESIENWKKVITGQQLTWPQFLDKDRKNASVLCIDYYPTNFLLDEKGNIIKKNIRPDELEKMLEKLKTENN